MSWDDLRPANEWELPAGIFTVGIVILAVGLSNNIMGVCCTGLLMTIASAFWIIKIRMKKIDPNIKELNPKNDLEERDWENHSSHFHM